MGGTGATLGRDLANDPVGGRRGAIHITGSHR